MKKLSHKQWIGVAVALGVIVIFYSTGNNLISYFTSNDNLSNVNNSQPMDLPSSSSIAGFEVQDIVVGTGPVAQKGQILTVHYTGAFTDGKVFDTSRTGGVPFQFTLGAGQVIAGWDRGIEGMRVGGKRRLVIPPSLAYGTDGIPGAIPPSSTLIFEVELLGVK